MENLKEIMMDNPIIAAVRNDDDLKKAINSSSKIVFVLYGNIMSISSICKILSDNDKMVFVHLDLIDGLKADLSGIQFIKKYSKPYGVISTKTTIMKHAKHEGLATILRIFAIDSLSLKTGIKNINDTKPNAVEIMPGVANKIIEQLKERVNAPVIAGGLIQTKKDIIDSLSAGAIAVSTNKSMLWKY
ncbi:glycerol-3-phosphate responsive antiterminator [Clostridium sediminicola]|uniref:glycerol-3-phosphate responsive antiterminator n=1 Tax=Clostridium sediminicola TaxID=3114879 RepID=UPI0031F27AD2